MLTMRFKGKYMLTLKLKGKYAGLISMNFLTEPVGLAPHILTEPNRKTMSPVETVLQSFKIISAHIYENSY